MKKIWISLLAVMLSAGLYAQQELTEKQADRAEKATQTLVEKYQLTTEQAEKVAKVEQRRQRHIAEIASLQTSQPDKYRAKQRAIRKGANASLQRMLTPEQRVIFKAEKRKKREETAAKLAELKKEGATRQQLQDAMLDMDQ